jgi:hypothetical protein
MWGLAIYAEPNRAGLAIRSRHPHIFITLRSVQRLMHKRKLFDKALHMFTPNQYRAKAVECGKSAKTSTDPNERRRFQELQHHFTGRSDNEQWLADNHQRSLTDPEKDRSDGPTLADEEEHVLRRLGAALIMQWNSCRLSCKESCSITPARWANCWIPLL